MNRRRFLKGTSGGVLGGLLAKFGIFPKWEPQPTFVNNLSNHGPYLVGTDGVICTYAARDVGVGMMVELDANGYVIPIKSGSGNIPIGFVLETKGDSATISMGGYNLT